MAKIIGNGAEAIITLSSEGSVWKFRPRKSYRIPQIDDKIRKLRTRAEARLIERASKVVDVPKIFSSDESSSTIVMEFISGPRLSDNLNSLKNAVGVCFLIGQSVAKLHDSGIIHGDLTTSNIILHDSKVFFIDFGLSFYSEKFEDKAVDIHLFKQALEAKHFSNFQSFYDSFIEGYSDSNNCSKVLSRLEKVELRGRYRH